MKANVTEEFVFERFVFKLLFNRSFYIHAGTLLICHLKISFPVVFTFAPM